MSKFNRFQQQPHIKMVHESGKGVPYVDWKDIENLRRLMTPNGKKPFPDTEKAPDLYGRGDHAPSGGTRCTHTLSPVPRNRQNPVETFSATERITA